MRSVWERWVPRVEDYWETFAAPYRHLLTDLIDKHTPAGGSVLDFGCGAGVQTFLLRLRRPDVMIYAVDCNLQARNLTQVLCGPDARLIVEDTPHTTDQVRTVDTFFSAFTCTYLQPQEIERILPVFSQHAQTMILAEPTELAEPPVVQSYQGMPTAGYVYPYGAWLTACGRDVETVQLDGHGVLNAIVIATKAKT